MFLSADTVEGNPQGMNPYAYVNGSPETHSDPSGRYRITTGGGIGNAPPPPTPQPQPQSPSCNLFCSAWNGFKSFGSGVVHVVAKVGDFLTGASSIVSDVKTLFDPKASLWDKIRAGVDGVLNIGMDVLMVMGIGEALRAANLLIRGGIDVAEHLLETDAVDTSEHVVEDAVQMCEGLSFASATLVATSKGEQAIGTMRVGEKVLAYNPTSHKMELEPVLHVWINHDNDLVDLTLTATSESTQHGKTEVTKTSETLHTNKKHPFLTEERGFLPVGQITLGMHILEANGRYGVVTGWKVVPGVQVMYNLEVAQDHTYTVGTGQWVVHNCSSPKGSVPNPSELIEKSISDLQSKPNNLHHIFDNPAHQWDLTGLDEGGNWDLIRTTLESNPGDVFKGGIYEAVESFGKYTVTVRGNFTGTFLYIGDAWINAI